MDDRPIYLEFFFREGEHLRQRWYVIEERAGGDEEIAEEAERGLKGWVRRSKTDRFNRLHLPNLPVELDSNGLAVKDSRLFIIGGYHHLLPPADSSDDGDEFMGFYSIDLKNATNPEWQLTNLVETNDDDLDAVTDVTLVYERTDLGLGLVPRWDESPAPRLQLFRGELPFDPIDATVVALTETQLYMFERSPGRLFCCDLKSRLWKTIDDECWAPWSSSGVLVEDNKYLLFFGSRGTDNVPGVYIYDIHREKWLPKLVQGLPNDEISLPTLDPCGYGIAHSFLIQVGRDEPKLAVVWSYIRGWNWSVSGSLVQIHNPLLQQKQQPPVLLC